MSLSRIGAALVLLTAAAFTTACAGSPGSTPTTASTGGTGVPSSPVATPEPTGSSAAAEDPTCETIIPETTVNDFKQLGWTVLEEPFPVGETQLADGLQCKWSDDSATSGQVFGWAPITDQQAAASRSELLADGWRLVEEGDLVYVTEASETAVDRDNEGYGFTYLFGDGWVKLADTKESLLLVEWPQE